ncbi:MAG: nicotinate phosphoribosyltransferase, partial [Clostridiales bacterium]|nr:nicotinate phosphoribosyltransferase [Clostridiales bacterium]
AFGVGERLITSRSEPVFGGVYKLAALEKDGKMIPKMKISENIEKITDPGFKNLYRLYNKDSHKAIADVITLHGEQMPDGTEYEIFDQRAPWKRKKISNFYARNLSVQLFEKGERVYDSPSLDEIRSYCKQQIGTLWDEILRFENPQTYYVDLSKDLWQMKHDLIKEYSKYE